MDDNGKINFTPIVDFSIEENSESEAGNTLGENIVFPNSTDSLRNKVYIAFDEIGDGAFGAVLLVKDIEGDCYAMKKFDREYQEDVISTLLQQFQEGELTQLEMRELIGDEDITIHLPGMESGAMREVSILRCLSNLKEGDENYEHPNIINLHDICWQDGDLSMVMPKMSFSVYDLLKEGDITLGIRKRITHGIISAVDFLHFNQIIHRDVKAENVLLSSDYSVKLCDFSLSKFFDGKMVKNGTTHTPSVGTNTYRSPEQIWDKVYYFSSDLWSIGVVIFEMLHGIVENEEGEKKTYEYMMKSKDKFYGDPLFPLMNGFMKKDPKKRMTCKTALNLELFQDFEYFEPISVFTKKVEAGKVIPEIKSRKRRRGGKRKKVEVKKLEDLDIFDRYYRLFKFTNPMTSVAAEIYHETTKEKEMYCVLVAAKMYEYYSIDVVYDILMKCKDFDIDEYVETEKKILIKMNFCLFV